MRGAGAIFHFLVEELLKRIVNYFSANQRRETVCFLCFLQLAHSQDGRHEKRMRAFNPVLKAGRRKGFGQTLAETSFDFRLVGDAFV